MKTMDTQRRAEADVAPVDASSKKLRQALLPFQVISPVGVSSAPKKRKITDDLDSKISKSLRIEKQLEIVDLTEAKENVNLESKKREASSNSTVVPPSKEKSVEPVSEVIIEEESICLKLDSPTADCVESIENESEVCEESAKVDEASAESSKDNKMEKCKESSKENGDVSEEAMDADSITSKDDESGNGEETELDKTAENADSSINVGDASIEESEPKISLSGSEGNSDINTSVTSQKNTPNQQGSVPKKRLLSSKQKEQREKVKQELERKKEEKREEKRKEKEERLLQKKKEKEEKKEQLQRRLSQKLEEKQKKDEEKQKRDEERNLKKKQKEEERLKKEEEKQKKEEEKQKKEEERIKKEEEKQKERQKKEERKKTEEEEEQKKKKAAAAFASFFVPKKSRQSKGQEEEQVTVEAFMPFRVKGDMRLAPVVRRTLSGEDKNGIELKMAQQSEKKLYLKELKDKSRTGKRFPGTWPLSELKDDVVIIEEEDVPASKDGLVLDTHNDVHLRAKLLQFCENRRPPYWGTWRKKSSRVRPRCPFHKDEKYFDYEVDSDDEWEEEEPGESLHGSDDEKESEDEYEVDNEFFVPHGYLSNEEAAAEEAEENVMSPETQKAKLKLLGLEFEEEMKQKTKQIKPQLVGCYWVNDTMDEHLSRQYEKIFSQYKAVTSNDKIPTSFTMVSNASSVIASGGSQTDNQPGSLRRKKSVFPEDAVPDLIKLLHCNRYSGKFLALEFFMHLNKESGKTKEGEELRTPGESPLTSRNRIPKTTITEKIKELASWELCTETGPWYGKNYWFVAESVRAQYKLTDLSEINHWKYNLKPKMRGKVKEETPSKDASPSSKIVEVGSESSPTPSGKPHLITKFTKVLSKEERIKQMNKTPKSTSKATEVTPVANSNPVVSKAKSSLLTSTLKHSPMSEKTPVVSEEPKVKKRVPLLVSVPRGQEIPRSQSLTSFLKQSPAAKEKQSISPKNDFKKDVKQPNSSDVTKVAAKEIEMVILD